MLKRFVWRNLGIKVAFSRRILPPFSHNGIGLRNVHTSENQVSLTRNIGVVAHVDAGKTTTTENMLYLCGVTNSVGRVDSGDTVTDFLPMERERGITIQSAAITMKWKDHTINLIDTPGHVDFTFEVARAVRVLDGAIVVIDAVAGVQAQTQTVWRQVKRQGIPAVAFINKMDRNGANFDAALDSLKKKLGANPVAFQMPLMDSNDRFLGFADLLTMTKCIWGLAPDGGVDLSLSPSIVPLSVMDEDYEDAVDARRSLLEGLADVNETVLELFLESEEGGGEEGSPPVPLATLLDAARKACCSGDILPVLCGTALKLKGVQQLLDAVVACLPSPLDRPPCVAINAETGKSIVLAASGSDMCALAFKVTHDKQRGPLVYIRTFSGVLTAKMNLFNSTSGHKERPLQVLAVSADDLSMMSEVPTGSVACLIGLRHTRTGDTLVQAQSKLKGFELDGLAVPKDVYSVAVEPMSAAQQTELEQALEILTLEDPSLRVRQDKESGQTLLCGIGELHLEVVCDKLKRFHGVQVETGSAYVAYRESLEAGFELEGKHEYDRTLGTKRLFAALSYKITSSGTGEPSTWKLREDLRKSLAADEASSLMSGLAGALSRGPLGYPITGLHVEVVAIERDVNSTPGAILACISTLIDLTLRKSGHILLEPAMSIEVTTPVAFVGAVLSDLGAARRAMVHKVDTEGSTNTIYARVPLAPMLGYATAIRSLTQGAGSYSMEFETYSQVDPTTASADASTSRNR